MTEVDIDKLVSAWIDAQQNNLVDHPSVDTVLMLSANEQFDLLWDFVRTAYAKDMTARSFGALAAGPLEDLLAGAGVDYIDEVESLAGRDSRFRHLLGGVWQNETPQAIWNRVVAIRGPAW